MSPLSPLLEAFYVRFEPRGVAFTGSARFDVSFGIPASSLTPGIESSGFSQAHVEVAGVSVYSSNFGWGKVLVAQFQFQEDDPPAERPWLGFVRLAARIQRYFDNPTDLPDIDRSKVYSLKPSPLPRPRPLRAEASPEET